MKNLQEREVYECEQHEIAFLALVTQRGLHFYSDLWEVCTDTNGKLYALVGQGTDTYGKYEDRLFFDMKHVACVPGIEIGLYKETSHEIFCERIYPGENEGDKIWREEREHLRLAKGLL